MIRLPISVCIVASNEAHRIRPALDSVREWVGEIIVAIDDKVTDGTDRVAGAYGAKVISQPWSNCAAHRNFASAHAVQPWLLAIDADEVISEALRDEIVAVFSQQGGRPPPAAYSFPRLSFFCGRWIRHGDWYPDRKIRLWRRGQGHWGGVNPHDRVIVSGRTGRLKKDLLHFSNESINRQIEKLVPFSDEFVRHRLATGRRTGWLDLAVRPGWRFFRAYVLRRGFLDGWPGYYIAWLNAFSALTRHVKVCEAKLPERSRP